MRTKTPTKAKEPVRLRLKELANGNKSFYLDIYQNGARSYEFLKLYLVPERTPFDKASNKNTEQLAQAIKAQRVIDITSGANGMTDKKKAKKWLLLDWMQEYYKVRTAQGKRLSTTLDATVNYIKSYRSGATLAQVDKAFLLGFIDHLNAQNISNTTRKSYLTVLSSALNLAVERDIIQSNPMNRISAEDKPKADESRREHLTKDELKKMIQAECHNEQVKQAFLFSCFCGLRYSDIANLTWHDIVTSNGTTYASITMQKTQRLLNIPLSAQALQYLPERGTAQDYENVFNDLPTVASIEYNVRTLAENAGIDKHLTFHCARHTFATMALSSGVDLYTTSKLLGHTDIKTTQIYAKIIDEKKTNAVNQINNFFNN